MITNHRKTNLIMIKQFCVDNHISLEDLSYYVLIDLINYLDKSSKTKTEYKTTFGDDNNYYEMNINLTKIRKGKLQ